MDGLCIKIYTNNEGFQLMENINDACMKSAVLFQGGFDQTSYATA